MAQQGAGPPGPGMGAKKTPVSPMFLYGADDPTNPFIATFTTLVHDNDEYQTWLGRQCITRKEKNLGALEDARQSTEF